MGKKPTNTTKTPAPSKRAVKPVATKKNTVAAVPAADKKPAKPAKPAARKPTANAAAATRSSQDDVALRAYFIAEKRHALGLPGDSHSDWLEAERLVLAERRARV